jgi:hypothetical protein
MRDRIDKIRIVMVGGPVASSPPVLARRPASPTWGGVAGCDRNSIDQDWKGQQQWPLATCQAASGPARKGLSVGGVERRHRMQHQEELDESTGDL